MDRGGRALAEALAEASAWEQVRLHEAEHFLAKVAP
jgi:hypothetical protein